MKFILDVIKGVFIGSGAILPGISSGVFCIIFGIYEKLVDSILNIFKDFKKNFAFLFPIALGGIIGVLLVSKLLKFLFATYPMPTNFCFIGLIIGSMPILFKKANNKSGFRLHYLLYFLFTFLIGVLSFNNFSCLCAVLFNFTSLSLCEIPVVIISAFKFSRFANTTKCRISV